MKPELTENAFTKNQLKVLKLVGEAADATDQTAYLVGGMVRDILLGKQSDDLDFVVSDPQIVAGYLKENYSDKVKENDKKDTARFKSKILHVKFDNVNEKIDMVQPRAESYTKESIKPTVTVGTFLDDVNRRDFTINALYVSVNSRSWLKVVDLTGRGLNDLKNMVLDTPLDPDTTFSDDPSRMLRCVRFAVGKNMTVSARVKSSIQRNAGEIGRVPAELIRAEFMKGCLYDNYFDVMHELGLLKVLIPEVCDLIGVYQRSDYHTEDAFGHTLRYVNRLPNADPLLRFAGLLHDIGKASTTAPDGTAHGHEKVSESLASEILNRFRFSKNDSLRVLKLVRNHMLLRGFTNQTPSVKGIRRFLNANGDIYADLIAMTRADILSDSPLTVKGRMLNDLDAIVKKIDEVRNDVGDIANIKLSINGLVIMNILNIVQNDKPARKQLIGVVQQRLLEQVIAGDLDNTPEVLTSFVKSNFS